MRLSAVSRALGRVVVGLRWCSAIKHSGGTEGFEGTEGYGGFPGPKARVSRQPFCRRISPRLSTVLTSDTRSTDGNFIGIASSEKDPRTSSCRNQKVVVLKNTLIQHGRFIVRR